MKKWFILGIIIIIILIVLFIPDNQESQELNLENEMKIKTAFTNNGTIPKEYTCDGKDINPPLEISEIPEGTKTLAIISDDPDSPSGTWVHWVVWNIPVNSETINIEEDSNPGTSGKNSFRKLGYGGPCPPSGTHRYFFKIYALDSELDLEEGAPGRDLENAMQGHLLDKAEIIGLYSKE